MCPKCGDTIKDGREMNMRSAKQLQDLVPLDQLLLSRRQTAQLEREGHRLTEQLKELIRMNKEWQRYDDQRESYVLRLHEAHRELLAKLASLQKKMSEVESTTSEKSPHLTTPARSGARNEEHRDAQTAPLCALDAKFARKEKEIDTLTDEIERLKEHVASLQRNNQYRRIEEEERIVLFKAQLDVCMEDFRQEKSDLQRARQDSLRLRRQLDEAEMTNAALREQINDLVNENRWLQDRPSRLTHHYTQYTGAEPKPHYYTDRKVMPLRQTGRVYGRGRGFGVDVPDCDSVAVLPNDVEVDGDGEEVSSIMSSKSVMRENGVDGGSSGETDGLDVPDTGTSLTSDAEDDGEDRTVSSRAPSASVIREKELGEDSDDGRSLGLPMTGVRIPANNRLEEPLKCPQCLAVFALDDHSGLLEHIEQCTEEQVVPSMDEEEEVNE